MSAKDKLKPGEKVIRGLLRLRSQLTGDSGRPHQDKDDFLRRGNYQNSGMPENGLSVFRRTIYQSNAEFYARIGSKKAMGASECALDELVSKGFKVEISGERDEHVSLRCPDCDMASRPKVCKPKGGASFADCPFFDKTDPLNLNTLFKEVEPPVFQAPAEKPVQK
ncbi:hypothetical protein KA344_16500 [bacterium]|jgi:hypothetical protein|nr:hypothetical protein [bacterium]